MQKQHKVLSLVVNFLFFLNVILSYKALYYIWLPIFLVINFYLQLCLCQTSLPLHLYSLFHFLVYSRHGCINIFKIIIFVIKKYLRGYFRTANLSLKCYLKRYLPNVRTRLAPKKFWAGLSQRRVRFPGRH